MRNFLENKAYKEGVMAAHGPERKLVPKYSKIYEKELYDAYLDGLSYETQFINKHFSQDNYPV